MKNTLKTVFHRLRFAYAWDHRALKMGAKKRRYAAHVRFVGNGLILLLTGFCEFGIGFSQVIGGTAAFILEPLLIPVLPLWVTFFHSKELDALGRREKIQRIVEEADADYRAGRALDSLTDKQENELKLSDRGWPSQGQNSEPAPPPTSVRWSAWLGRGR